MLQEKFVEPPKDKHGKEKHQEDAAGEVCGASKGQAWQRKTSRRCCRRSLWSLQRTSMAKKNIKKMLQEKFVEPPKDKNGKEKHQEDAAGEVCGASKGQEWQRKTSRRCCRRSLWSLQRT